MLDLREAKRVVLEGLKDRTVRPMEALQANLLMEILEELTAIRQATEAQEADPDAEPNPFQTLNGPNS